MFRGGIATFMKWSARLQIYLVVEAYWKDFVQPISCVGPFTNTTLEELLGIISNAGRRRNLPCM